MYEFEKKTIKLLNIAGEQSMKCTVITSVSQSVSQLFSCYSVCQTTVRVSQSRNHNFLSVSTLLVVFPITETCSTEFFDHHNINTHDNNLYLYTTFV